MATFLSSQFVKESWGKRATELTVSHIPFIEKDVLGTLKQYAICANDIRARNLQSEAITTLNGKRTSEPRTDFLALATALLHKSSVRTRRGLCS
ncbi:hypothetical protein [Burkholderia ambifaria]|uniref:hypothetical protein n=1 Tax=Burkholderia ambifaria TaxID=152480 RepID=UPI001FC8901B|nr:hypothetical protein [Burkholderia ambifaria]